MRRELGVLLLLLGVLGAGWLGYRFLFVDGSAERFEVVELTGEVRHIGSGGAATAAEVGQQLDARDRLVAGTGGRAVLAFGPETRITMEEGAAVRVISVSAAGVDLDLEDGKVKARVKLGGGTVGIRSGTSTVVADDADFTVARDSDGNVGVTSERGEVGLRGVDETTVLREGERLVVPSEGAALVSPASEALLLYLAKPQAERTREAMATVTGQTQPGAKVRVAGLEVRADAKGNFSARVPLKEGENTVAVEAHDVLGNRSVADVHIVRDTRAPSVGVEIRY